MKNEEFYEKDPSFLTISKIKIYEKYITGYLIKVLMGFENCLMADLFCGRGKSGTKKGSPLVLIEKAEYILTTPRLKEKDCKIFILFNDSEKENTDCLKKELNKIQISKNIEIFDINNEDFNKILPKLLDKCNDISFPKFFFLDPFTYSTIKMTDLSNIMKLKNSEILLFCPIFHSYRFATDLKMKDSHKTKQFINSFTTKGVYDYKTFDDYVESMCDKLEKELKCLIRPVVIDHGSKKNALFLITRRYEAMLHMNTIMRDSFDGKSIDVKEEYQSTLSLKLEETLKIKNLKKKIIKKLREEDSVDNDAIKKFGIGKGFLPKEIKSVLREMYDNGQLEVFDNKKGKVISCQKWGINTSLKKIENERLVYFTIK